MNSTVAVEQIHFTLKSEKYICAEMLRYEENHADQDHLQKQSLFIATADVTSARFSSVIIPHEEAGKPPASPARSAELVVAGRRDSTTVLVTAALNFNNMPIHYSRRATLRRVTSS